MYDLLDIGSSCATTLVAGTSWWEPASTKNRRIGIKKFITSDVYTYVCTYSHIGWCRHRAQGVSSDQDLQDKSMDLMFDWAKYVEAKRAQAKKSEEEKKNSRQSDETCIE